MILGMKWQYAGYIENAKTQHTAKYMCKIVIFLLYGYYHVHFFFASFHVRT